ncbi:MAG: DUF2059 domain-containing protein [Albidovulum sp.]|uniref:DUF2059 domain-containing protein n=1 Tax=Albidovulum sp. TaxID=1872424 RepID=UPI003CB853D4
MLRPLAAPAAAFCLFLSTSGLAAAADDAAALQAALKLPEVFSVMSEEGLDYGRQLEADMFPGSGGRQWQEAVTGIYSTDRMLEDFGTAFEAELNRTDTGAMLDFFSSDLGQRVTTLEISARRALLDDSVEDASRLKLEEMRAEADPRIDLIAEFVTANDLIEANVTGGLNANYAFYLGLADADALGREMSEDEVIAEVWGQEDDIREETDLWINSYLAMAYAPLTDAELHDYIAFSRTEAGKDLNRALFAGFDAVFNDVSRQLGRAAGAVLSGQDL